MRISSSLALALVSELLVLAPTASTRVHAQTPAVPKDSVPKDSQPKQLQGPGCEMCILVVVAAFGVVMLTAPPSFMLIRQEPDSQRNLGFADDHFSVYLLGGGNWEKPGLGWVHSEGVEALKGRFYGELRIDSFDFSDLGSAQFQTIRTGYLLHPLPHLLGGVTIGYRRARGDSVQNALEIGLPLVAGAQRAWFRLNPTYLISSAGVTWNFRFQTDFPIYRTPLVLGFNVEARTLRQGGAYFGTMAVVLGTRF